MAKVFRESRKEKLHDKSYTVYNAILVKEQVLNGELLPKEEIQKSALGWNGRPVVITHPRGSANSPENAETFEIGLLYNVRFEESTSKLKGEIWLDDAVVNTALSSKDEYVRENTQALKQKLDDDEPIDVSTAYYVNTFEDAKGLHKGVAYNGIQRNIIPDHLALLPLDKGASSWADGSGMRDNSAALRRHAAGDMSDAAEKKQAESTKSKEENPAPKENEFFDKGAIYITPMPGKTLALYETADGEGYSIEPDGVLLVRKDSLELARQQAQTF